MDFKHQDNWFDRRALRFAVLFLAGILLIAWSIKTPTGLLGKADAIGYAVCHRIDGRSFHIGDRQLPLCVRCSGQYLGAVFSLVFMTFIGRRRTGPPPKSVVAILAFFALIYVVDGLNSYFHLSPMMEMFPRFPRLYEPNNTLRLLTGSAMGYAVAVLLLPTFNRTIWSKYDRMPVLENIKQFGMGLMILLLIDILIISENPVFLYPLAVTSVLGVLFLLSMIYSLVITMIFHLENRFRSTVHLIFPLTSGLVLALFQIGIMDAVRYILTGTWEGFQL